MPSAATIRLQIEAALGHKVPSALTPAPRVIRPVSPIGVSEIDALLDGGLPVGAITEMIGPESSGRTAVALSLLRHLTHAGRVCAWVDVSDTLSPESAAAAGIDLARLLWVRCGVPQVTTKPSGDYKFSLPEKYLISASKKKGLHGEGCGGHPRNEVKGLSGAVSGYLSQRPLGHAVQSHSEECKQCETLSLPPRSLTFHAQTCASVQANRGHALSKHCT